MATLNSILVMFIFCLNICTERLVPTNLFKVNSVLSLTIELQLHISHLRLTNHIYCIKGYLPYLHILLNYIEYYLIYGSCSVRVGRTEEAKNLGAVADVALEVLSRARTRFDRGGSVVIPAIEAN